MITEHAHVPEQPVVILVVGVPGAGKSTVARALAERPARAACAAGDLVQHHFTVAGLVRRPPAAALRGVEAARGRS